jgi:hypothetical protein
MIYVLVAIMIPSAFSLKAGGFTFTGSGDLLSIAWIFFLGFGRFLFLIFARSTKVLEFETVPSFDFRISWSLGASADSPVLTRLKLKLDDD